MTFHPNAKMRDGHRRKSWREKCWKWMKKKRRRRNQQPLSSLVAHRAHSGQASRTVHGDAYQFISSPPVSTCKPFDWNERISLNKSLLTLAFWISAQAKHCWDRVKVCLLWMRRNKTNGCRNQEQSQLGVSVHLRFSFFGSIIFILFLFHFGHLFDRKLVF